VIGFGLKNGGLGCVEMTRDEPIPLWSLEGSQTNGSPVALVKCAGPSDQDGLYNFIAVRDDGTLEVYAYEHKSPIPQLRYETQLKSQVTGIDIGMVTNPLKQDIVISCHGGQIMTLSDPKGVQG